MNKKAKSSWCPWDGDSWLDTLQLRFLTGPIIPTTAPFWSSMQNSQNIVPSQRWENVVLLWAKMQLPGPCRAVLLVLSGSQRGRGEMRRRTLMMVLREIWEREREIFIILLSRSLSVAAVLLHALCLPKFQPILRYATLLHFTVIHDTCVLLFQFSGFHFSKVKWNAQRTRKYFAIQLEKLERLIGYYTEQSSQL